MSTHYLHDDNVSNPHLFTSIKLFSRFKIIAILPDSSRGYLGVTMTDYLVVGYTFG